MTSKAPGIYAPDGSLYITLTDGGGNLVVPYSGAGQCKLSKSGSNLLLAPKNGNKLLVNGSLVTIPSAGVTLAPTALVADTTYNIYAYLSSGTLTLETSATARATDTSTGIEIKSGDATRTFVGIARIVTGPAWASTATKLFVLSHYNRQATTGLAANTTADATVNSVTYAAVDASLKIEFLTFSDEIVVVSASGPVAAGNNTAHVFTAIAFDGVTAEDGNGDFQNPADFYHGGTAVTVRKSGLSEGYHYAQVVGSTDNIAYTGHWAGGATQGNRFSMNLEVKG